MKPYEIGGIVPFLQMVHNYQRTELGLEPRESETRVHTLSP